MRFLAALAFSLLAAAGADAKDFYDCTMNVTDNNHVISQKILVEHDRDTDDVLVLDAFIQHYVGQPVIGRVTASNNRRVTFEWELKNIKPTVGRVVTRVIFRLTVQNATKQAHAVSIAPLYDVNESGFGSCKVEKG